MRKAVFAKVGARLRDEMGEFLPATLPQVRSDGQRRRHRWPAQRRSWGSCGQFCLGVAIGGKVLEERA